MRLVRSPLVLSFIDRARPGDLYDPDPARRAAAWANWCIDAMVEASNGERQYPAIKLPGAFYDPRGSLPKIIPHLEVPRRKMDAPDAEFPDRLAQMGNGMSFPYWRYDEVTALRRALLKTAPGPIGEFLELVNRRRAELVQGLELVSRQAQPRWAEIAQLILEAEDGLRADATDPFSSQEVAEYLPAAGEFGLEIRYDQRLADKNGPQASRRVGVWQISGETPGGDQFSLGVVTPRLTVNSLFTDELFEPQGEAPAALLVRALVLRRLARRHLGNPDRYQIGDPRPEPSRSHLRAVPARTGQKLPEASVGAAMRFLEAHPDPMGAWHTLEKWSERGYILTVTEEGFTASHRRAARTLGRMEDPERTDIDCLLPLAWDVREDRAQVVRVTFSGE